MKPAIEWLNEVGETVMKSCFAGGNPPGIETQHVIEKIQADALEHAAGIITINLGDDQKAFDDIFRLYLSLHREPKTCVAAKMTALVKETE